MLHIATLKCFTLKLRVQRLRKLKRLRKSDCDVIEVSEAHGERATLTELMNRNKERFQQVVHACRDNVTANTLRL